MTMGERLKQLRLANGLTQEELAAKVGLQKSAIAKYENGRSINMKRSVIEALSQIFDCSPSYLMGFDDTKDINAQVDMPDEYTAIIQALRDRPEMKVLFKSSSTATAEQLKRITEYLEFLKGHDE